MNPEELLLSLHKRDQFGLLHLCRRRALTCVLENPTISCRAPLGANLVAPNCRSVLLPA
ncbi:unnamed protein product [Protopolystoma xenopodis]|uniref:Uncharacterized protein n=1 Tax=Protopolystoma xenopodis TaxID=117903 RepID=A0A448X544_9PLAT|nr:unnamed protein product [Protopolystoma xenopodis]